MAIFINIFRKSGEKEPKGSRQQDGYPDVELVKGVYEKDARLTEELFKKCKGYFDDHFQGKFFKEAAEDKEDIFQNSFIKLWEKIQQRKIYVEDGCLKGRKGEKFNGKLTTYLMSIANYKYLEWVRDYPIERNGSLDSTKVQKTGSEDLDAFSILYGDDEDVKMQIVADCISHMAERCNQILSMFYLEGMKLDRIWENLPTITTYDALKNGKSRCYKKLKECANGIYEQYKSKKL